MAELVRESGSVTVATLEEDLGISPATARRDLAVLERQGKVKRTHGGAVMPGFTQLMDGWIYASRAARRRCLSTPVDQAGVFETPGFREG